MTLQVRNDDYRIRPGTFTSGSITATYSITAWTVQSDQMQDNQVIVPWLAPFQAIPPEFARIAQNADGSVREDGFLHGVLPFPYWTFGQMNYLISTYFSGGVYSALVSMLVYDRNDAAMYLNATLFLPVVGQDMDPEIGGYKNIKLRYGIGVVTA